MDQRVKRGYRFDREIMEALESKTRRKGISPSQYIENLLLIDLKESGDIPEDKELLGEVRGGRRKNAGRKSNKV